MTTTCLYNFTVFFADLIGSCSVLKGEKKNNIFLEDCSTGKKKIHKKLYKRREGHWVQ